MEAKEGSSIYDGSGRGTLDRRSLSQRSRFSWDHIFGYDTNNNTGSAEQTVRKDGSLLCGGPFGVSILGTSPGENDERFNSFPAMSKRFILP
jgi:hypothetical protein